MSPPSNPAHSRTPGFLGLAVLIVIFVAVFHLVSGSPFAELGSHPDEAAHYVTGLMVHDYLAGGMHGSPLHFADDYYRHYPKIGLGIWPPFFYVVQALWTLVAGSSVVSVLRLIAVLEIALALLTAAWLWREFGPVQAVPGALLLVSLPLVQQYSNMVMAEILSALLMFGAAGCFALYLESAGRAQEWRAAIGFGVCAGLAIMTKGTGLALAFVPVLGILFSGRVQLLKARSLWVAALIVLVIAGPWTWHFRNQGRGGWEEPSPSIHFTQRAIFFYAKEMAVGLGGLVALLALAGALSLLLPNRRSPAIALCSLALVLGVWIFQCLTPVGLEARHLTPAMPALIILAMSGLDLLTGSRAAARIAAAAGLLAVFYLWPSVFPTAAPAPGYGSIGNQIHFSSFRIPLKRWSGFAPIVDRVLAAGAAQPVLVASDSRGEGMFIAAIAARDPHRPSYTIQRASKLLAASTWSGSGYQAFYQNSAQVRGALEKAGIALVVTDSSLSPMLPHQKLLLETLTTGAAAPSPLITSPIIRDGNVVDGALALYPAPATH
jgi:hypothetical protein